jgi:exopolysaccharide production protein ExoZ
MPLLESVGDASFSLYLLHGIVFAIAHKFLTLPPAAVTMIAIVLSIGVALLSYRFFERPVARWLHQHMVWPKSRPKSWRDPAKKLIGTPDPER